MNTKDVIMIILLLVVLAIVYKLMQASKLQVELATGMAKKMGVEIKKPKPRVEEEEEDEEETEDTDGEEVEEDEEDSQDEEEETQEEEEEEIEVHEEDASGKTVKVSKAVSLRVTKPKKKSKEKPYEKVIACIREYPLPMKDLLEKYEESYGAITQKDMWRALTAASRKGLLVKHQVSDNPKRYMYATPEMLEDGNLKEEYQVKTENQDN